MASFECIFAKTDTDEANNKVFHCVKTVFKCRFTYISTYIHCRFRITLYTQETDYRDITAEFKSRNIGICAYANLNDRSKVHSEGFDRAKDKSQVK